MKTLKAKRMAAVAAGAALLGLGIAAAGPLTFQSVPIISNSGQPLVQVVVGHAAKPSDGVAAANIAAAIGNLAFASVPVTATINATQASKVLHVAVSGTSGSTGVVPDAQVYFNTSGVSFASGTYGFSTLIGSVLNRAIKTSQFADTKAVVGDSTHGYPSGSGTFSTSSVSSPYSDASSGLSVSGVTKSDGGGVSFQSLSSSGYDNILRVTNSNLPALMNNAGSYSESEYLWLAGFPVYNQSASNFELESATGAYQVVFNKPINWKTSSNTINNAAFSLIGENWTIINATIPTSTTSSSTTAVAGGKVELAASLKPEQTVYVGQNVTSGNFTVELADLGQPNANGVSNAALNVYYNGVLKNTTSVAPGSLTKFNVSGTYLYVDVNQTFAGLYAYEKYAKMKLYSNVFNVTSGGVFNKTYNPNWYTVLEWTNSSGSASANADALYSIILYNTQDHQIKPGQSFSFITSPAAYSLKFVGENQGSGNFDPINITSVSAGAFGYQNLATPLSGINTTAINEPAQEMVVKSSIPNAFTTSAGQQSSTLTYDLTPYQYEPATANAATNAAFAGANTLTGTFSASVGNYVNANVPLYVYVSGYALNGQKINNQRITFYSTSASNATHIATPFKNVTNVTLSSAIPLGTVSLAITENSVALGTLSELANAQIVYSKTGQSYDAMTSGASVKYNQQNGQTSQDFTIANATGVTKGNQTEYYTYTMNELPATPYSTSLSDSLSFGIFNSTAGAVPNPLFYLNYTNGGSSKNNMTYTSSQTKTVDAGVGFRTEKGSKIGSISATRLVVDMAKAVDMLSFDVAATGTNSSTLSHATVGPVGLGQSLSSLGMPNVTVSKVTGTLALGPNATYSITGISNITATPSVTQAVSPVLLKNLTTNPLVVLDNASTLNPASSLVLIGSGYVNTLSGQVQSANNFTASSSMGNGSGYVVQAFSGSSGSGARIYVGGYTAADTTAAANAFIQDLYSNAASGS